LLVSKLNGTRQHEYKLDKFTLLFKNSDERRAQRELLTESTLQKTCPFYPELYPCPEEYTKGVNGMTFDERVSKSIKEREDRMENSRYFLFFF
jgi:hypothetical protein